MRLLELDPFLDLVWVHFQMFADRNMFGSYVSPRRGRKGARSKLPTSTGLSLVRRNHYSHRSTYSQLLDKIRFVIFHCEKLSVSLAFCLKVTYSGSSFCIGSAVLLGGKYLLGTISGCFIFISSYALMISRPQQKDQAWRVQNFRTRGMKHRQEILVACKETEAGVEFNFPLFCITRKHFSGYT